MRPKSRIQKESRFVFARIVQLRAKRDTRTPILIQEHKFPLMLGLLLVAPPNVSSSIPETANASLPLRKEKREAGGEKPRFTY